MTKNVIGKICPSFFKTRSQIGGMLHRRRGNEGPWRAHSLSTLLWL